MTDETQEHSIWSPSSAHGWRRCKARIRAERGRPDKVGREAAEGTIFHEHAELALSLGIDPAYFRIGVVNRIDGHDVSWNEEMVGHLQDGLEYLRHRIAEYGDVPVILMVEQKVSIEPWTGEPGGKGTSDVCIIFPTLRLIIVFDWKYGKIVVSPIENDQLTLYGLGCWETFAREIFEDDPTDIAVELIIWQPRVPGGGGKWETTMEKLLAEGEKIKQDAEESRDPNAPFTPGPKQCLYCKASTDCKALADYNLKLYSLHFDDIADDIDFGVAPIEPDLDGWTPEKKAWVLLHKSMFERWFKKLHEEALQELSKSGTYPLLKAVAGKNGHRFYADKAAAKRILIQELGADKAVKEELISPAVAQSLLKKKRYDELLKPYVDQPRGKPILVPETDPRPALPTIGQEFDQIADEDEENGD